MALDPASDLKDAILNLSPTTSAVDGMTALVGVIADYVAKVQGGPTGSPGIFALLKPLMILPLTALPPVSDNSWAAQFGSAFLAGSAGPTITPGTVMNPAWIGSGTSDAMTLPLGTATIVTLSAAVASLISALQNVPSDDTGPQKFAEAIHDAVLQFTFLCIGLGPPPVFPPIPIPTPAQ